MKLTKQQLNEVIKEEVHAELKEGLLKEGFFDRVADQIFNWLIKTVMGQKTLERANAHVGRMQRSGERSAYR